jgi:hypothetical protein
VVNGILLIIIIREIWKLPLKHKLARKENKDKLRVKISITWNMTPCSPEIVNRHFASFTGLHGVIAPKITTSLRTSNPINQHSSYFNGCILFTEEVIAK